MVEKRTTAVHDLSMSEQKLVLPPDLVNRIVARAQESGLTPIEWLERASSRDGGLVCVDGWIREPDDCTDAASRTLPDASFVLLREDGAGDATFAIMWPSQTGAPSPWSLDDLGRSVLYQAPEHYVVLLEGSPWSWLVSDLRYNRRAERAEVRLVRSGMRATAPRPKLLLYVDGQGTLKYG